MIGRLLMVASLLLGVAIGGALLGLFRVTAPLFGTELLVAPESALDPGIPFPWSDHVRTASELQEEGIRHGLLVLATLAVTGLGVGAGSAALLAGLQQTSLAWERAVRGMLGATPVRLLTSHGLRFGALTLLAGVCGLFLALTASQTLLERWPGLHVAETADPWLPLLAAAVGTALVLGAGLAPFGRVFKRGWLLEGLAPHARRNPGLGEATVRTLLLIAQATLSMTVLYSAMLLWVASELDHPSFEADTDGVILVELDAAEHEASERRQRYREVLDEVRALPGVESSGLASYGTVGGRGTADRLLLDCRACRHPIMVDVEAHALTAGAIDVLGLSVERSPPREGEIAVNETLAGLVGAGIPSDLEEAAARELPAGTVGGAFGKSVRVGGIVSDLPVVAAGAPRTYRVYPFIQMRTREPPVVYLPFWEYPAERGELLVRVLSTGVKPGPPADPLLSRMIADQVEEAATARSVEVEAVERVGQRVARLGAPNAWMVSVATMLGIGTLLLCLAGMVGIANVALSRRVAEFGVRRVLGATRRRIVARALGELLLLLAVAGWLGLGIAVAAGRALAGMLPWEPSLHLHLFGVALLVTVGASLVGAAGAAFRSCAPSPAKAIRGGETAGSETLA